jgi:hypothetical protein
MALNDIIKRQIANAFTNTLGPGGLTESITVKYFVSAGDFDVEEDTAVPVFNDVEEVLAVVAKPSFDDVKDHKVIFTDAKLVIPGPFLPAEPQADTDKVIRANGEEWDIRKVVGVPGGSVWLVFIYRT